jgi:hypothetical protein
MALIFFGGIMRYYYERPINWAIAGDIYRTDNELFNKATLFKRGRLGLLVIQLHFNPTTKHMWWSNVDPWIASDILSNENFKEVFNKFASEKILGGDFPVIQLRKLMWELRMKPLKKEFWES